MRRFISCGILLAFLFTAMHIVVDHGVGGQNPFALLPHPCASSAHSADHSGTHHHDQEDDPWHGHHPPAHQAETHSHFTGYPSVPMHSAFHIVSSVLVASADGIVPLMLGAAALCGNTATSPPRSRPLSLRSSVLRI
jgi:hypothetical protein